MSETSASTGPAGRVPGVPAARASVPPDARRWLILGTVGLAQLMVVLDATIVSIALPSAQRALGFPRWTARRAMTGIGPGPA
jgi:hypothetical protein